MLLNALSAHCDEAFYPSISPRLTCLSFLCSAGIDVTRGYTQITREFLPIRTKQLLGAGPDPVALYGPQGVHPLLPEKQPDKVGVGPMRRKGIVGVLVACYQYGQLFGSCCCGCAWLQHTSQRVVRQLVCTACTDPFHWHAGCAGRWS